MSPEPQKVAVITGASRGAGFFHITQRAIRQMVTRARYGRPLIVPSGHERGASGDARLSQEQL